MSKRFSLTHLLTHSSTHSPTHSLENIEFTHIFAHDNIETNTAQVIHVNDVYRPYAVLDDLSYKITKAKNAAENGGISKVLRDQYLSALTAGDLRVEEEKQIIKNLASGKKL